MKRMSRKWEPHWTRVRNLCMGPGGIRLGSLTAALIFLSLTWFGSFAEDPSPTGSAFDQMSGQQLLQAIAQESSADLSADARIRELKRRIGGYSQDQITRFVDEIIGVGQSLEGREKWNLTRRTKWLLPSEEVVRMLREVLLTTGNLRDGEEFISAIYSLVGLSEPTQEQAAGALFSLYFDLAEEMQRERRTENLESQQAVLSALGNCGEAGLEKLLQLPWKTQTGLNAMGQIGNERAVALLLDFYQATPSKAMQCYSLVGLCRHGIQHLPEATQNIIREGICRLLEDENAGWRGYAIGAAESSKDPYFIPYLENLAETDPSRGYSTWSEPKRDGSGEVEHFEGEAYQNRRSARQAIEAIKMADPVYSRARTLEQEIASLRQQLEKPEAELASGALSTPEQESWTTLKGYLESEIAKRETELAGLGSSPTPPSP